MTRALALSRPADLVGEILDRPDPTDQGNFSGSNFAARLATKMMGEQGQGANVIF